MKLKPWLVPTLLGAGILIIILSLFGPKTSNRSTVATGDLAFLSEKTGLVYVQNFEMPEPVILKTNFALHSKDSIRTGKQADALIQFDNEGQFRLNQNTEVLLELMDNNEPVVIVNNGEISIEKFGRAPSFWVRKDGQSLRAVDFALSDKKNAPKLKDQLPAKQDSTLSQTDIETVMSGKKTDFFKCFGQTLQKNPQARGQVLIAFKIEKNGQTTKIEISKSDIMDNSFKTCLLEVVARTQFKAFSGSPIQTIFPLKFE